LPICCWLAVWVFELYPFDRVNKATNKNALFLPQKCSLFPFFHLLGGWLFIIIPKTPPKKRLAFAAKKSHFQIFAFEMSKVK
jgi:hypothetical protein